jgi:2-polyprenyl-3-methyl-5-hydroxy-6-metoxy-1,4-benzoquinol methylase
MLVQETARVNRLLIDLWWADGRHGAPDSPYASGLRDAVLALYTRSAIERAYAAAKMWLLPFEQLTSYLPSAGAILDVGCGFGYVANYLSLANPHRTVIGTDPSEDRIRVASGTVGTRSNVEFLAVDCRDLRRGGFSGVVITDVLHHAPYDQQLAILRDVYGKLAPGGTLVMRETAKKFRIRYFLFNYLLEQALYAGQEKARFRRTAEWQRMLEEVGFRVLHVIPNGPLFPYTTSLFVSTKADGSPGS